ncbi:MAG: transcriptional regulator [Chloroflexi bacterium RBG_16_54_18]|nr:MAG: transcriptional regulator [Chloroflexi bacterium RBG_16_54_18]
MPEICRFFGIVISMNYNDHSPPHLYVHFGEMKAVIATSTLTLLAGYLSPRTFGLVMEWTALHQAELMDN